MAEQTAFEYLSSVLRELACSAAQGAAYPSWSDDFARKEIIEIWADKNAPLRHRRERRVTLDELRALTENERHILGFGNWDENLILIPLWAFNYIADGQTLESISGDSATKGQNDIDLDVRFGCIAYGFKQAA